MYKWELVNAITFFLTLLLNAFITTQNPLRTHLMRTAGGVSFLENFAKFMTLWGIWSGAWYKKLDLAHCRAFTAVMTLPFVSALFVHAGRLLA
jgi:hypothetical protein